MQQTSGIFFLFEAEIQLAFFDSYQYHRFRKTHRLFHIVAFAGGSLDLRLSRPPREDDKLAEKTRLCLHNASVHIQLPAIKRITFAAFTDEPFYCFGLLTKKLAFLTVSIMINCIGVCLGVSDSRGFFHGLKEKGT
jgi:hypothetical protein